MLSLLPLLQVFLAVVLVSAILLQQRGVGLGAGFGGEGNVYRTKRGMEKILFRATIVLVVLFLGSALAGVIIAS